MGASVSATRDLRLGSSWRQCSEDVASAKSNSNRLSKENKKGSVPTMGDWGSVLHDKIGIWNHSTNDANQNLFVVQISVAAETLSQCLVFVNVDILDEIGSCFD